MKFELQKNIEASASAVRSAKNSVAVAEVAYKNKVAEIEELRNELDEAGRAATDLSQQKSAAQQAVFVAEGRYAFYCKEAVEHPY